jgi:membrane protein implicated in regulation of membrane protease activity
VRPLPYVHVRKDSRRQLYDGQVFENEAGTGGKDMEKKRVIKTGNSGYVQIDGDLWKAVSQTDIPEGTSVRVIGRKSTIITVETL